LQDDVAVIFAVIAIALFFAPALLLGQVYLVLVFLYLLALYISERAGLAWLEGMVSVVFALVFAFLLMEKLGQWDVRLFLLFAVLALISAIRRLKNESSSDTDAS